MSSAEKSVSRKELLQRSDEFLDSTRAAWEWARKNTQLVGAIAAGVVAVCLVIGGIQWFLQSREDRAARDYYAAELLFTREQWDAARDSFVALSEKLAGTRYGKLANLMAGHAALRGGHADQAATQYRAFLDSGVANEALRQTTLLGLAEALEASGDRSAARTQLDAAMGATGPATADVVLALGRLEAGEGNKDKAIELFQRYLKDFPEGGMKSVARTQIVKLGGTPPPDTAGGMNPFGAGGMMMPPGLQVLGGE